MKRLLFLTDYHESDDLEHWFLAEACREHYQVEVKGYHRRITGSTKGRRFLAYLEYLRLTAYALSRRERFDCMIFWAPTNGLLVAFLASVLRIDIPKLVLVNLVMGKNQGLRRILYWIAQIGLRRATAITVSSREMVNIYARRFGFRERIHFLPDAIYMPENQTGQQGNFIFSGGRSFRDWRTLIEAVRRVPDERFVIVAGELDRWLKQPRLPDNVEIFFADVPKPEFDQILSEAKLVVIPLLYDDVPAGTYRLIYTFT